MMKLNLFWRTFTITCLLCANPAYAKVSPAEAAKLGAELTPLGAEKKGNAKGTIPEWTGGIQSPPSNYAPGKMEPDPFPGDKPLFTISASNMQQYKDQLSPGQRALLKAYPSWKMPVYKSRRSASFPQYVYDATIANATRAELVANGNAVKGSLIGVPFPIPKQGVEAVFNHNLRWRAEKVSRTLAQAAPTRSGDYTLVKFSDQFDFYYGRRNATLKKIEDSNLAFYFKQKVTAPARLVGSILLVHETLDQVKEPRRAWTYNTGQRRVRRAPNVAYDNPGTAADGMRTADNFDMFNGAPDRYEWTLKGKKELYIPYNSYRLHSDKLEYADILKKGHINPEHTRYELHRVWVVEGVLKTGTRHLYAKRTFYIDEDTWQISVADHYDARGELWRVAEAHALNYYQVPVAWHTLEVLHDLQAARYLVLGLDNQEKPYNFNPESKETDYTPAALRREGRR